MKKLLLLLVLAGAGYYYYSAHYVTAGGSVDSYQTLLKKSETSKVTREEVKIGANDLVRTICNGSPVIDPNECMAKYANYREMCESRIFGEAPETYSGKDEVIAVARRYRSCVGLR